MYVVPELLAYWSRIPIDQLEREVAQFSMGTLRLTRQPVIYSTQPVALEDAGRLYYEDMPCKHNGQIVRDATEIMPSAQSFL